MRSKPRKKDSGIQDSEKHDYNPVDGSKDLRMTSPDSRWPLKGNGQKEGRNGGNSMCNMILKLQKSDKNKNRTHRIAQGKKGSHISKLRPLGQIRIWVHGRQKEELNGFQKNKENE